MVNNHKTIEGRPNPIPNNNNFRSFGFSLNHFTISNVGNQILGNGMLENNFVGARIDDGILFPKGVFTKSTMIGRFELGLLEGSPEINTSVVLNEKDPLLGNDNFINPSASPKKLRI